MDVIRIGSVATAFIRTEEGVNAGLIHTPAGKILIDTTSSPAEARSLLEAVGASPEEVRLVINTHSHSDHTWGNQVFSCPILAHHLCRVQMVSSLEKEWSQKEIFAYISDLEKTDPQKAQGLRDVMKDLHIKLPSQVFTERFEGVLGGLSYEVLHLGGHTPDLSVVWLPETKVLFASDLIFQGRYPYIFDADIPGWIAQLDRLLEFKANAILPGHGVMCGEVEILSLKAYLQETWYLTEGHIRMGHSIDQASSDPSYPIFSAQKYERLHRANIRYMYEQLVMKGNPSGQA